MPTDRRQSEKATIEGYFHEFPSAHALLDITCKIAVSPQRSDAFSSCCKGTCMSNWLRGLRIGNFMSICTCKSAVTPQQRVASRSPLTCKLTELDYTSVGG